jgi:eukaryotic-like serine/threonine-protein kinase
VPTLVNQPLAKAQAAVSKLHMTLKEGAPVKSITIGAGSVVNQSPKPGTSLKEGSVIKVQLSDGPPNVAVPNLANMTCAQAGATLQTVHLNATCTPGAYNDSIAAEMIISWSLGNTPNPTEAPYGSTITMVPSLGHQPATVPNIPNTYSFAQAQAALSAVGLTATQANDTSTTVAAGDVISTTPASGASAPFGSAVTVTVSTGPPTTQVPNVIGDTVNQADSALQAAGLSPAGVSGNPSNNVVGTQPSIGSTVPTGSSVQLFTH